MWKNRTIPIQAVSDALESENCHFIQFELFVADLRGVKLQVYRKDCGSNIVLSLVQLNQAQCAQIISLLGLAGLDFKGPMWGMGDTHISYTINVANVIEMRKVLDRIGETLVMQTDLWKKIP